MKMLVVDDQPAIRAAIAEIVRTSGDDPVECADAAAARAAIAGESFPVVLLDVGLPGEDGISLCRWLRTQPHGLVSAVIGITGSLEPEVLQELLDAGADDFLAKPFRAELLAVRIKIAQRRAAINAAQLQANQQLSELNSAKSEFVSMVSHEFRTPLTSIQGFAELIKEGGLDEAITREFAGLIHDEALRLGRLISDMLDLDRIESGRVQLALALVDFTPILEAVIGRLAPAAPRHQFELAWPRPLPLVAADPDKMTQVLSNLLHNAVKYSPNGGTITIGGEPRDGWLELWVRDQGMGIPAESLDAIFERFTRVEGGAHRAILGTGLGLAIVREIVSLHGGSVTVTSEVGQGSTFTVALPIDDPAATGRFLQPVLAPVDRER